MANIKSKSGSIFGAWEYKRTNYLIFLAGIVVIALGYIIMATGERDSFQALTLSPIMLVTGYLVLIPLSILYRTKR
ncbi:DUF3098 domain-containing protein [Candidatus Neomarinimicrobiota bacterium]